MTLATNKQLGFVAAIFTVIASISPFLTIGQGGFPFPNVPAFNLGIGLILAPLSFIGFILFLIAMYGLSKDYQDPAIFNYVIYGLIAAIVLGVVLASIAIFVALTNLGSVFNPSPFPGSGTQFLQDFYKSFLPVILIVSFVGLVPAAFNMAAFNRLAQRSGVRLFKTVGLLGVVAAAVTIAFWFLGAALFYAGTQAISDIFTFSIVGSAVTLAAWILGAKAFHSIPAPTSETYWTPPAQAPTPPAAQVKYCPHCGTANTLDAEYCTRCGKKL